jgi:hypothetical protein
MSQANGPIATIWADHAGHLADWADRRLVNRRDRWGGIRDQAGKPGWYKANGTLNANRLARHFKGAAPTDIIGAYSIAADPDGVCWSLWLGADIDHHGTGPAPEANWRAARALYGVLVGLAFRPILEDSNGNGGSFHVWVLFSERVQTATVRAFGLWLVRDWKSWGLDSQPEVFPKQAHITPGDYGNLLRLPGRHYKNTSHWSRIWDGSQWLEGEDAIDWLVNSTGDDPALIPQVSRGFTEKTARPASSTTPSGDLEALKRQLVGLAPELGAASVGWRVKHRPEGGNILVGTCPFEHDSGTSNPDDLAAGFHDDRPYIKCKHESCKAIPEINRRLRETDNRPEIFVTTEEMVVNDRAVAALAADATLFQRNHQLVHVVRSPVVKQGDTVRRPAGTPIIRTMQAATLKENLTSVARWRAFRVDRKGELKEVSSHPPGWSVAAILARGKWEGIRQLAGIVEVPTIRSDGSIIEKPGYDDATDLLYLPTGEFPHMPARPAIADARRCV